jgi:c-di-AMP phosphodiesterase-like protein
MLAFKFDLSTQFENPIVAAIMISCIVITILFFVVPDLSFAQIKYVFIPSFITTAFIFHMHYNQLKKKFYDKLVNQNSVEVMDRIISQDLPVAV